MTATLPAALTLSVEEAVAIVRQEVEDEVFVRLARRLLALRAVRGSAHLEIHVHVHSGHGRSYRLDLDEEIARRDAPGCPRSDANGPGRP